MTDKELRKLRRSELLELLIEQKKIASAAQKRADEERGKREEADARLKEILEINQRLSEKIDEKDQMIRDLHATLEGETEDLSQEVLSRLAGRLSRAVTNFEKAVGKLREKE